MSGGKGKISNYTQRFKKHYNRFIEINDTSDNSKLKKMEIWGQMKGIYKFLQLQKATYKVVDEADVVSQVSGLEKMKENINNSTDLSNKEGYDKAMECLDKGDDTILSDGVCVSYNEFVNGDARDAEEDAAEAEPSVPAPVPAEEDENEEVKSEQGGGRSRRHTRPSRHIKPQKSRKVRRTRRKHRSVRR